MASAVASYAPQTNRRMLAIPGIAIWLKASDLIRTTRFGQALQALGGTGWSNTIRVNGAGAVAADTDHDFIYANNPTLEKYGTTTNAIGGDPGAAVVKTTAANQTLTATETSSLFTSGQLTAFLVAQGAVSFAIRNNADDGDRFAILPGDAIWKMDDVNADSPAALTVTGPSITVAEMSGTTGTVTAYDKSGKQVVTVDIVPASFPATTSPKVIYTPPAAEAYLFEVILFNRTLSSSDVGRVVSYLKAEYRIP